MDERILWMLAGAGALVVLAAVGLGVTGWVYEFNRNREVNHLREAGKARRAEFLDLAKWFGEDDALRILLLDLADNHNPSKARERWRKVRQNEQEARDARS